MGVGGGCCQLWKKGYVSYLRGGHYYADERYMVFSLLFHSSSIQLAPSFRNALNVNTKSVENLDLCGSWQ